MQGDALSPILCNIPTDPLLIMLSGGGFSLRVGERLRIAGLAYADNLALVAGSYVGIQSLIDRYLDFYHVVGLAIKRSWFSIRDWDKSYIVNDDTPPTLDGIPMKKVSPGDKVSYCGIPMGINLEPTIN